MKCDKLEARTIYVDCLGRTIVYFDPYEVNEAIKEIKQKLQDQCISCPVKMQEDDVVAELKADYKEACDRLQTANLIKDEQLAATRHQKYRRCLAMVKYCEAMRGHYLSYEEPKWFWYREWSARWLELAEKFKDKEAK